MKFRITMKDPDGIYECTEDAIKREVMAIPGLSAKEREAVFQTRRKAVNEALSRWFEYGDYVTVEIDTDAGTATVVECGGGA